MADSYKHFKPLYVWVLKCYLIMFVLIATLYLEIVRGAVYDETQ